jgi:predicted transcriptional regulator of viral defense system
MRRKIHHRLNIISVQRFIKEKSKQIFTPLDLQRYFRVNYETARKFISRGVKKGLYLKLKKGLYASTGSSFNHYSVANRLYSPSYISFDTALSHYGIIPETVYPVTSAAVRNTRRFVVGGIEYTYQRLQKEFFTGYRPVKYQGEVVLLAEPEKALADFLYFIDLQKRNLSYERLNLKRIHRNKLMAYARLFNRPKMKKLIEKIYADFRKPQRIY